MVNESSFPFSQQPVQFRVPVWHFVTNWILLRWGVPCPTKSQRNIPCRLSGTVYSIYSQLPSLVWRWVTGWMIGGSSPGRGWEFFSLPPRPDRLWGHPDTYPIGTKGSFMGVKRAEREADHSPPPSAQVKNGWSYISAPPISLNGLLLR
jgi:hypothetical protein